MTQSLNLQQRFSSTVGSRVSPRVFRAILNGWPLLIAMGIRVTDVSSDWSRGCLELRVNRFNANMHGTAFGGTLFSMTDVLFGTLVMQRLGPDKFEAWTRFGSFEYIKPGRRGAYLDVEVSDALVDQILRETDGGYSTVIPYTSVVRDRDGEVVGIGQQDLYVRRRGHGKQPSHPRRFEHVAGEELIGASRTLARLGLRGPDRVEQLRSRERLARRCIEPEARAIAWLEGLLDDGYITLEDVHAAGLPEVVIEALSAEQRSPEAQKLLDDVNRARS